MKFRVVSLAVATVALATPTLAADMPVKARAPAAAVCGNQFNGFYLGGNVGAVAYTATRTDIDGNFADNSDFSANKIGATAGVQAGYDWQFCNKLFGVVADWNWSDTKAGTQVFPNAAGVFGNTSDIGARLNWFSTVRARAGLVVDNALFYVTGGLAIADIDSDYTNRFTTFVGGAPIRSAAANSFSQTRYGFAAGAGTEVLLGGNWTLNAEFLYLQFEQERQSLEVPVAVFGPPATRQFDANDQAFVARVGLNYRFNGGASALATAQASMPTKGPVLARSVERFNGAYIGVNGATVSYTAMRHDQDAYLNDNGQYSATKFGYSGGVQAGYDWQSGARLFGIVGDINYADTEAGLAHNPSRTGFILNDQSTTGKMSWYGTLRGRLGLVADDLLIYVTGGLAVADIETTIVNRVVPFGTNEVLSTSDTRWGWTAGVGTETALWGGWSLVSELLYMQFDKANNTFQSSLLNQNRPVSFESHDFAWVSKVGVNYRGSAFAAPGKAYAGPARFTGLYIGGNVGGVGYTALRHDADSYLSDNGEYTSTKIGATVGGQIGYDWQFGNKVFGVVADANWVDVRATSPQLPSFPGFATDISTSGKMGWFGTLRTRGGVAFNDVLVYGTGGFAVAGIETDVAAVYVQPPQFNERLSSNKTRWGWTGGMGAEFAFANNWSVTGEVLYMQFKQEHDTFRSAPLVQNRFVSFDSNDSAWVGKVGVNYRFNSAALLR